MSRHSTRQPARRQVRRQPGRQPGTQSSREGIGPPSSRHRAETPSSLRPRYGRMAVLAASLATTAIAVLGGTGVLPSSADSSNSADDGSTVSADRAVDTPARPGTSSETPDAPSQNFQSSGSGVKGGDSGTDSDSDASLAEDTALPAGSGSGRRAVFSESRQRVWIVGSDESVQRTYPVSGSVTDNLDPGTYEVYSRNIDAVGIDDSGTMKYFVRFTQGPSGAAIGFHDIPIKDGRHTQSVAQLGSPQSHGCIRAHRPDAQAMWAFAQQGTAVVVTA